MSQAIARSEGKFFLTMSIVSVAILFLGFAPSFYLKPVIQAPPPLSQLTIAHGIVGTAWMALFIAQAAFVATGRQAAHRQLGIIGAVLFGAMTMLGYWTAITAGELGHAPPASPEPLAFMALPLIALTGSLALVVAALWNRRYTDWHKRLMLAAMFSLTGPGTGRIVIPLGFAPFGSQASLFVPELLLAIAMAYDYSTAKKVHPAYLYGATVIVAVHILVTLAFVSPLWLSFAHWLTQT